MFNNPFTTEEIEGRLNALRKALVMRELDAAVIASPENVFYLTGLDHWGYFAPHLLVIPADGGMILASLFFDHEPPRLAHGMVEKFAQSWPFVSQWFSRVGQLPGLPEHAARLLRDDRVLMVFPEGARGTGKLYKDRYQLVRFGTGFMRIALQTRSPIVPIAFIGGEEALPTIYHAKTLAKIFGAPYWPVPPYLVPMPMPLPCEIHFGEPLVFEGTGNEADHIIEGYVEQVKDAISKQIKYGCALHGQRRAGLSYDVLGERP